MVNNVVLVGRITRDPEIRTSSTGTNVCNFSLAINRNFKNNAGEYDADFVNCVAFNQTATLMEQYVAKGQLLSVQGRIQTRNYDDKDGRKVYVTEVVCNTLSFLESKRNANTNEQTNVNPQTNNQGFDQDLDFSVDDDDLPF